MSAADDGRNIPDMLAARPGVCLSDEQSRRATCLALALELTRGRSVPIQVVERIARWLYTGEPDV